jgi:hypothetical protein
VTSVSRPSRSSTNVAGLDVPGRVQPQQRMHRVGGSLVRQPD